MFLQESQRKCTLTSPLTTGCAAESGAGRLSTRTPRPSIGLHTAFRGWKTWSSCKGRECPCNSQFQFCEAIGEQTPLRSRHCKVRTTAPGELRPRSKFLGRLIVNLEPINSRTSSNDYQDWQSGALIFRSSQLEAALLDEGAGIAHCSACPLWLAAVDMQLLAQSAEQSPKFPLCWFQTARDYVRLVFDGEHWLEPRSRQWRPAQYHSRPMNTPSTPHSPIKLSTQQTAQIARLSSAARLFRQL